MINLRVLLQHVHGLSSRLIPTFSSLWFLTTNHFSPSSAIDCLLRWRATPRLARRPLDLVDPADGAGVDLAPQLLAVEVQAPLRAGEAAPAPLAPLVALVDLPRGLVTTRRAETVFSDH